MSYKLYKEIKDFIDKTFKEAHTVKILATGAKAGIPGIVPTYKEVVDLQLLLQEIVASSPIGFEMVYEGNTLSVVEDGCYVEYIISPHHGIRIPITIRFTMKWNEYLNRYDLRLDPTPWMLEDQMGVDAKHMEDVVCMFYAFSEAQKKYDQKFKDFFTPDTESM